MIIYKCDKCGDRLYQAALITITVEHCMLSDFTADTYHFCPDCFRKFASWVDEEDDEDDLH